ncbi:MAG: DinB family protein [Chloroflexi bacterium]|nr:DinB family protein [Chloroflexota bacterium]
MPLITEPVEVAIAETFHSFASAQDPEYLVNAFFADDRRPPGYWDVALALRLLQWTRQDLLQAIQSATPAQLNQPIAGEVSGSIAGIMKHIAGAENWYLNQLDSALDRAGLPDDPLDMLTAVRANTRAQLVKLVGDERITLNCGESWSARKVIRRALWHERDHTQHIAHLLAQL